MDPNSKLYNKLLLLSDVLSIFSDWQTVYTKHIRPGSEFHWPHQKPIPVIYDEMWDNVEHTVFGDAIKYGKAVQILRDCESSKMVRYDGIKWILDCFYVSLVARGLLFLDKNRMTMEIPRHSSLFTPLLGKFLRAQDASFYFYERWNGFDPQNHIQSEEDAEVYRQAFNLDYWHMMDAISEADTERKVNSLTRPIGCRLTLFPYKKEEGLPFKYRKIFTQDLFLGSQFSRNIHYVIRLHWSYWREPGRPHFQFLISRKPTPEGMMIR